MDDAELRQMATVLFAEGPAGEFDYLVPEKLLGILEAGMRVKVPLGRGDRAMTGYCVRVESKPMGLRRLKEVRDLVDERNLLSPAMLRLTEWIAEHYLCPWGQVLEAVVPAAVRGQAGTRLTTLVSLASELVGQLSVKARELKLTAKQTKVLQCIEQSPQPMTPQQLSQASGGSLAVITALRRKNLLRSENRRIRQTDHSEAPAAREERHILNADQQAALDIIHGALNSAKHEAVLLYGITGSGKTEVYIRAIEEVVSFGRQAIVLVPEISLTPQTKQRFRARFGDVAVLHSHLSDAERHWHWDRIARGEVPVIVGARSAVFAPTPHLGLIILDEEHESSFKQETAPRYHARDVALRRAEAESVPLVLGSATPSLESWQRAMEKKYRLVEMPRRVLDRPLPIVDTIDLRNESHSRISRGAISRPLHLAMNQALEEGGQVILLLNRRGFSTHIQCPACGLVLNCPNCSIALTHHRTKETAVCHYCEHEVPAPSQCPDCEFKGIRYGGLGTQRLEAEVKARFPDVRSLRMDTDTMQGPSSHEKALQLFREGEVRILLGTQMIAKGLDFPNVTLVGVVNADTALHLPDFRAAERTCQLLVQVAGRTGRGDKGGRVLIQTSSPDHSAIKAAVKHDYRTFVEQELPMRQMLAYPPLAAMIRLVVRGPQEATAKEFAAQLAQCVITAFESNGNNSPLPAGVRVLGPAVCPFAKLRGNFRFQIHLQGPDGDQLRAAIRTAAIDLKPPENVQWIVDVDPWEML